MSFPESSNGSPTASPWQRLAIAAGTLIIVALTVVAAIFLAIEPSTDQVTPTATLGSPPATLLAPTTPASELLPTDTPSPTPTPSVTPPPSETPTQTPLPSTATQTPVPPPPTFTPTPLVIVVTPTPEPASPAAPPATPAGPPGVCQPPPTWVAYVTQTGDTLDSLAARTNTTVFDLQQVNCLESFTLQVGQTIYLPFPPATPTVTYTPTSTQPSGPTSTRTPTPISPQIESVTPNQVDWTNSEVIITVLGRNFRPREADFRVELRGPANVSLQLSGLGSDTSFDAIVPPGLPEGTYDLVVTNPHTERAGVRSSAFTIGPAPTPAPADEPRIESVNPRSGLNDRDVTIRVEGDNFKPNEPGFRVQLRIGQEVRAELELVGTATSESFNAIIRAGLEPNLYDLWVINPDGQDDVRPAAYESRQP